MIMTKTKFTPDQKIQIVMESIKTSIGTAELCRKHNVHPPTFQTWRQRFMESGKAGLTNQDKRDPVKAVKKENERLKRLIGDLTVANDILKKPWRKAEIECRETDEPADESAQGSRICKRLKARMVLQAEAP